MTTTDKEDLQSAAPDLLKALKEITEAFCAACAVGAPDHDPEQHSLVVPARAAIAKAEGRGQ